MSPVTKWEAFCLNMADQLEQEADNQNKLIALMAGVPYDPKRIDGGTAFGIRRAADYVRGQSQSKPEDIW